MMPVQQLLAGNDKMIRTETPVCTLIALNIMQTHKELHSARKSNDQLLGYSAKYVERNKKNGLSEIRGYFFTNRQNT